MHRFAIVVFLMVLFCAVASSFSATIHVPSQQPTIQAGINAAVNGDTVLVAPGVYSENLVLSSTIVTLRSSAGHGSTTIQPLSSVGPVVTFSNSSSQQISLEAFTIIGANTPQAILITGNSSPTITNCVFKQYTNSNVVIRCEGTNPLIFRNQFYGNGGISCVGIYSGTARIINNTFSENARGFFSISGHGEGRNNIVTGSTAYGVAGSFDELEYNDVWNNNPDYQSPATPGLGSISADPEFQDEAANNYFLLGTSPCIDAGDPDLAYLDPDGSRGDMGAVYYDRVRRSLVVPSEYATIQEAINAAVNGDTVLLLSGTYGGSGNSDLILGSKRILLTGAASAESTVINCSGLNSRTTVGFDVTDADTGAVIRALTIRNASVGITTFNNIPKLRDLRIEDCQTGCYIYFPGRECIIKSCQFLDNSAGLTLHEQEATVIVDSCAFEQNTVAFDARDGVAICTNSSFSGNGVAVSTGYGGPQLSLDYCSFFNNTTALYGSFTLANSIIANSVVAIGCPFYFDCELTNVTITGTTGIVLDAFGQTAAGLRSAVTQSQAVPVDINGGIGIRSCHFFDNQCELIYVTSADVNAQGLGLENSSFHDNDGGITFLVKEPHFRMIACEYSGNLRPLRINFLTPSQYSDIEIAGCTFANNRGDAVVFDVDDAAGILNTPIQFSANIMSANSGAGFRVNGATPDSAFNTIPVCCNSFNNMGGNYVGFSDPSQINGNLSSDPKFCDTMLNDYHIAFESPCAPSNNSCSQLIGALTPNCTFMPSILSVSIEGENLTNVLSPTPKIQWAVSQPVPSPQDSFLVAVGTDNDWQFAEKWNPAPFASEDTFVTYDGSALLDGQTYYLRLRVRNTLAWSDWYQTSFRMNSVPTSPVLRAPTNLAVVGSTPTLWVTNGTDAESDPLTYEFAGFHDTDCVAGPAINLTGVSSGVDSTGGQIIDPLAENCRYWWMARAFDGYEYSPWTSYAQFLVNGTPEAPSVPTLDYPPLADNKPIFTLLPTLGWQISHDPDPGDTVRYKLELSDRANFSFALVRDSLLSTDLPLIDSLEFGTHYYWRVTAKDKSGLSAMSGVKEFWTWKLGDMNHSHTVDLSDLSLLIAYLTQTPRPDISPKMVADLTGDCRIDLSDLSTMVAFMTTTGVVLQVGCE